MSRRFTSRRNTIRGGAWFNYAVVDDNEFNVTNCNKETKQGNKLMRDIDIAKKFLW